MTKVVTVDTSKTVAINTESPTKIVTVDVPNIVTIETGGPTKIVNVAAEGPQGPVGSQGPQGPAGPSINTGSFATTGSNIFTGTQYVLSDIRVSSGNKIYTENISGIVPQPGISSYSDPITQLTSQGDFNGETIKGAAGENLESGQLIYLYTDGLWYKTNATPDGTKGNASATSLLGIVVSNGSIPIMQNDIFTILLQGNIYTNQIVGGEAPGSSLWIDTNIGNMRNSAPASSGNVIRQVGHILTTHVIRFNPDNYYSIV